MLTCSRFEAGRAEVAAEAVETAADTLTSRVRDTSIGIPGDQQERVFEPFRQQLDAGPTRRAGGAGLGLTVCRQLAELPGGAICLDGAVGAGSTFSVRLPSRLG